MAPIMTGVPNNLDIPLKFIIDGRAYPIHLYGSDTEVDIYFNNTFVGSIGGTTSSAASSVLVPDLAFGAYTASAGASGIGTGILAVKDNSGTTRYLICK